LICGVKIFSAHDDHYPNTRDCLIISRNFNIWDNPSLGEFQSFRQGSPGHQSLPGRVRCPNSDLFYCPYQDLARARFREPLNHGSCLKGGCRTYFLPDHGDELGQDLPGFFYGSRF